jgi:hypothetical protein
MMKKLFSEGKNNLKCGEITEKMIQSMKNNFTARKISSRRRKISS